MTQRPFYNQFLLLLPLSMGLLSANALSNSPPVPAVKKPTASIPSELKKIEAKYSAAKTLEAKFTQTQEIVLTGSKKESSGIVILQVPNKFRWETLSPDKNLLVSDGSKFWFYTPPFAEGERGQVIEKKTSDVQSELASVLLTGNFSSIKNVKIKKKSKTLFQLIPDSGVAGSVKSAEIEISKKGAIIERVLLEHEGGNKAEVRLSDVKLGTKIDPHLFKFFTPAGTDLIKE